jgi:glycosyltransferase involved in cell wall biosynthesis
VALLDQPAATHTPSNEGALASAFPALAGQAGEAPRRHKVLLFIPHLQQGGAERQILALCARLPPNFEPILCVADDRIHYTDQLPPGQPRHILGVRTMGPQAMRKLAAVLAREKPDILHCYRDKANFWGRLAARKSPVPIILTGVRNRAIGLLYLLTEWYLSRSTDRVLTNSVGVVHELVRFARVKRAKIQVLHNFIDLEQFHVPTPDEKRDARAKFGIRDDELALLIPGRIGVQKHHIGLVRALGMLRRRGILPKKLRVLAAGRLHGWLYTRLLPRYAKWHGVADRLEFMGAVKQMTALYHAADAMVLPSLFEGLPNVVLEAQASGLPAVVSHAANLDGIVLDQQSGFEVPTFDSVALADALAKMFATSPEERLRMGAAGRAHVAQKFSPERILQETVKLYDSLLAEKGLV